MADTICAELRTTKPLSADFCQLSVIKLDTPRFTIGRSLTNSVVIAFVGISRAHCILQQKSDNTWTIQDVSRFGTNINGHPLVKSEERVLNDKDVIQLDMDAQFTYSFLSNDSMVPKNLKRKHSDISHTSEVEERIQDAKTKFDMTQAFEIVNMERKIMSVKKHHLDTVNKKVVLETCLSNEIVSLENTVRNKMIDLVGEDSETLKQRELLAEQLSDDKAKVRQKINLSIANLEKIISDQELQRISLENENKKLLERLEKERERFEKRLEDVTNIKQRKLNVLEKKLAVREEEILTEEKNKLDLVQEQKLAQEQELINLKATMEHDQNTRQKEIETLKLEMQKQHHSSTKSREAKEKEFTSKLEEIKQEAEKAKRILSETLMQHQHILEAAKMQAEEKLERERKQLQEALVAKEKNEQSLKKIQQDLLARESSVRLQMEEEKASWMSMLAREAETRDATVKQLQDELAKFKSEKKPSVKEKSDVAMSVPEDKQTCDAIPSTSKCETVPTSMIDDFNQILESELQCSICTELFIVASTLNCSHTFCKLCISTWRKRKNECPICREPITMECGSLVLDTFIEKIVGNSDASVVAKRMQTIIERAAAAGVGVTSSIRKTKMETSSTAMTSQDSISATDFPVAMYQVARMAVGTGASPMTDRRLLRVFQQQIPQMENRATRVGIRRSSRRRR